MTNTEIRSNKQYVLTRVANVRRINNDMYKELRSFRSEVHNHTARENFDTVSDLLLQQSRIIEDIAVALEMMVK